MKFKLQFAAHAGGSNMGHAAQGFRNAHGHLAGNSVGSAAVSGTSASSGSSGGYNNVAGATMGSQG